MLCDEEEEEEEGEAADMEGIASLDCVNSIRLSILEYLCFMCTKISFLLA